MSSVDLRSLVAKFDQSCRNGLEQAVGYALSRGHYNVEIEHVLLKLLEAPNTDLRALLDHFDIDQAKLAQDLTRTLERFKTGNTRTPSLSPNLVTLGREAWLLGSLQFGAPRVRTGHLLAALFSDDTLAPMMREASPQFRSLTSERIRNALPQVTANTAEAEGAGGATQAASAAPATASDGAPTGGGALDQFTENLTEAARQGKLDRVAGRDSEVRQIIDILSRRRQNNPILTGEAGVGKTAVVEGFALRVAEEDVPEALKNAEIRTLDLGLLQAGASAKGEFENRLKSVVEEVKASPKFTILFIDEAHTLIGAGGQAGQGDAANLLKPALARGELRTIAATTWAEYKKYFERDAALARRFQVVNVDEPDEARANGMLRGLTAMLEAHHGVRLLDAAVKEAVRLSSRYVQGRQLPDKAVSVLDTACARVAMSQSATPPEIEDLRRRGEALDVEIAALDREAAAGDGHGERLDGLRQERQRISDRLSEMEDRWGREIEMIERIRRLRAGLEGGEHDSGGTGSGGADEATADAETARGELRRLSDELAALQGEMPLVHPYVDEQAVASVVSTWTGIPLGRIVSSEMSTIMSLQERLGERVVGQPHALEAVAEAIRGSRAGLTDPGKPVGVFLMVGTSGVGKTETAMALADLLYGGEQNLTVINMSEFKEEHKVSMLVGSPPGYVGYGEGGVLTEAVRRRPYGVVLLDELEKAHPGVQDIFYQVFDKGTLKDGEGRDIDFKNTLIIMTSNTGTNTIEKLSADPETMPEAEGLGEALRPELLQTFKPAFLGRTTLVPYLPLDSDTLRRIAALQLDRLGKRIADTYGAGFEYDGNLLDTITARCQQSETGARNIEYIINKTILPRLSGGLLQAMGDEQDVDKVHLYLDEGGDIAFTLA